MLSKIKKFKLYYKTLHKGELLKRIEYKLKDCLGYFYIRNKIQNKNIKFKLSNINLNMPQIGEYFEEDENYKVFGKECSYQQFKENLQEKEVFWRKIKLSEYRDIKIIWEYNRLQILLPIAIKYLSTKNEKYKRQIEELLAYWERNNKFEYTVNWNSNLEVAIRAINIALTLLVLQDNDLNTKYSTLLYLHAKHIYNEIGYSDSCIPNNHVLGEATALLLLARIIDDKENQKWYKRSIKILEKYIDIIDNEGMSKENSFSYQFFVTKMYILNLCFIEEKELFSKTNKKVCLSLEKLMYLIKPDGNLPNYGDNDDGYLFGFRTPYEIQYDIKQYYNFFCGKEATTETAVYNVLFEHFNKDNKIALIEDKDIKLIKTNNIFAYKWKENYIFFNAKDIKGHAHNDSLSIELMINGKDIFVDSGTYSYNQSKNERSFYRSREAHNTIQLEGNAQQIGSFRWVNRKKAYLNSIQNNDEILKIKGTIQDFCERIITIYKKENKIDIEDTNFTEKIMKEHWITLNGKAVNKNTIILDGVEVLFNQDVNIEEQIINISKKYLQKQSAKVYKTYSKNNKMSLKFTW